MGGVGWYTNHSTSNTIFFLSDESSSGEVGANHIIWGIIWMGWVILLHRWRMGFMVARSSNVIQEVGAHWARKDQRIRCPSCCNYGRNPSSRMRICWVLVLYLGTLVLWFWCVWLKYSGYVENIRRYNYVIKAGGWDRCETRCCWCLMLHEDCNHIYCCYTALLTDHLLRVMVCFRISIYGYWNVNLSQRCKWRVYAAVWLVNLIEQPAGWPGWAVVGLWLPTMRERQITIVMVSWPTNTKISTMVVGTICLDGNFLVGLVGAIVGNLVGVSSLGWPVDSWVQLFCWGLMAKAHNLCLVSG
ncbi:hypothetical protein R6Q59_027483 [Mikania micrantha]